MSAEMMAAEDRALAAALDHDRLDAICEFLTLASKCAAGGALAAEDGDVTGLAVRTRQSVVATREALRILATLGTPEVCE
jgi:hypothetical protein